MNAVSVRNFGFGESLVRVVDIDEMPWFVAKDVCSALAITGYRDALTKLDEDEKDGVGLTDAMGREQETTVINESGVYTLALRCRDATKKGTLSHRFRKWITSEVLPTIRRTGRYEQETERDGVGSSADGVGLTDAILIEPVLPLATIEDIDRVRVALLAVREARRVFGPAAARRTWRAAGLPAVECGEVTGALADWSQHNEVYRTVNDWLDERCDRAEGQKLHSKQLYDDYEAWCRARDEQPVSVTGFGVHLKRRGFYRIKDNKGLATRVGLRLKTTQ